MNAQPHTYYVYVVELSPAAAKTSADRRAVRAGARVFYVGQTGLESRKRLARHLGGGFTSNRAVRDHALRLVGHAGPHLSRTAAEGAERWWARWIRGRGHVVVGGH